MIKCIIVDDEIAHIDYFKKAITSLKGEVELIGFASSVIEGIQLVNQTAFDILFLDVQMPPLTGFDLLKAVANKNFEVVFTTSFDKYALDAIKFSALDYLLKPYSKDDLFASFEKYKQHAQKNETPLKVENLLHNINPNNTRKKIGLSDKNGIEFFDLNDIIYCKAENVYTTFYFENKKEIVTSKPLKDYERELEHFSFFRIHNSYLINMMKVSKYIRGDGGQVKMTDGTVLDVARNKKESFIQHLQEI